MEYHEWLKQLKVGDEVIYHDWSDEDFYSLLKVAKITPAGSIRVCGVLFSPDDGHCRNGSACILNPKDDKSMRLLNEFQKKCYKSITMKNESKYK